MHIRKKMIVTLATCLCVSLVAVACSSDKNNGSESATATKSDNGAKASDKPISSSSSEKDTAFAKYDTPIELTTVRSLGDNLKFAQGEDLDHNIWTKDMLEQLGIKIKNNWSVARAQYDAKLNVTIASNDLPDFFYVNAIQLKQLAEAGQIIDLKGLVDKYGSPIVKQFAQDTRNGLASATFDGKLMGLAAGGSTLDQAPMVWIRKDWLTKLNLSVPKTMDDLIKISDAFTSKDPDGNGKPDTYGLALQKNLYGGFGSLDGYFNGYHAYPKMWVKGKDGNLVYGSIQPEMKTALAKLQELYKNGQIDKEFGVKDSNKEGELVASGKIGMTFGQMPISLSQLGDNRKNDPKADWQAYPIVSVDSNPAMAQIPAIGVSMEDPSYLVVSKSNKHPEAAIKLLNLVVKYLNDPSTSNDVWTAHSKANGNEVWMYPPVSAGQPEKNLKVHQDVVAALDKKDPSGLNAEENDAYNHSVKAAQGQGDVADWGFDKVFGREGSYATINQYVKNNLLMPSEFYGTPTQTMGDKFTTLQKSELETFTKIIMGASIDSFDKFVSDWKSLGGDQITKEVNDWAKSKK
ncbi:extracellular solute-binding protein [Paenibacillus sp. LMG 31461]|uniref:Extracellular solute-binding protein n=1 Tax=Paenibacillus plantarum TaxID=2654975 RepID=A0ABX1X377_9BACL|nr:extracellular solute-binding protein [Paenibacillus plantarum]NOU62827.1 extracellular solute-binding protein [Paenibacillus plantarum]